MAAAGPDRGETTLVLTINIMYEKWEEGVSPGVGPMANPLTAAVDHQAISWAEYGTRTGVWELLSLLEEYSVTATFHVSGIIGESHPDTVVAIARSGHEVAAHGWAQNVVPGQQSRDAELASVRRTAAALRDATGESPVGWLSPRCTPSADTAALLIDEGFCWFGDVFDTDLPYLIDSARGSICAVPFTYEVNDLPLNVRYGRPLEEVFDDYVAAVAARRLQGGLRMLDVTLHTHLGGRPRGLMGLRRILDDVRGSGDVVLHTKQEIARLWRENADPRSALAPVAVEVR
jgi:peptidoglycan/xylan/chitin deacetylase (PgdA/CDA1 family)